MEYTPVQRFLSSEPGTPLQVLVISSKKRQAIVVVIELQETAKQTASTNLGKFLTDHISLETYSFNKELHLFVSQSFSP